MVNLWGWRVGASVSVLVFPQRWLGEAKSTSQSELYEEQWLSWDNWKSGQTFERAKPAGLSPSYPGPLLAYIFEA